VNKIILTIVSPQKLEFSGEVENVIVPGSEGELGILPGHAELATTLKPGNVKYSTNQKFTNFPINGGFIEISNNQVNILSD
tara:strand:- start:713 stop:955 length:243 start_codon:yes stop_codon:yes gene_type:complete